MQHEITKANITIKTDIELEGEKLTLGEVIVAIRQLREELPYLKQLTEHKKSKRKTKERQFVDGQTVFVPVVTITEVLFNKNDVQKMVKKYEKLIDKMQTTINRLNISTLIDYVDEEYKG